MPFFLALAWSLAINLGIYLLQGFLTPGRKQELGRPNFPTADPEKFLPIIFGTVRLPINVFRTARIRTEEIKKTRNIIFGWGPSDVIGHRYYFTLSAWLCHGGLAGVNDIIIDGKYFLSRITPQFVRDGDGIDGTVETTITDSAGNTVSIYEPIYVTYTQLTGMNTWFAAKAPDGVAVDIKIPALFGDPVQEGGVQGRIRIYPGDGSHNQNAVMQAPVNQPLGYVDWQEPHYPEYAYLVLEDVWLGNSGNAPGVEVVVSRGTTKLAFGNPLYGYPDSPFGGANNGFAQGDVNFVGAIYEILTNRKLMIGFPRSLIDVGSFEGAYFATNPDTAGEFLGGSGAITSHEEAEATIKLLLAHVDAILFMHPETGLLTIKLIREFGGDPIFLTQLRESDFLSFEWNYSIQNESINEIAVEFTNVYRNLTTDIVRAQNLAAIQRAGRTNTEVMQFPWITRPDVALKVAQRELRVTTSKIGRGTFTLKRSGMFLTPGQHVRVWSAEDGIEDMICRVATIDIGSMADGRVSGTLVQDRWASEPSSYVAPPSSDPDRQPDFRAPIVDVNVASDTLTSVVYNLIITDPLETVTAVEYSIQYGTDPVGAWFPDAGAPYALEVLKGLDSFRAFWRVTYTDQNGVSQILQGEFPQPVTATSPVPPPQLSYEFSGTDVIITAFVDPVVTGVRFATGLTPPSDATVLAATPDTTPPFSITVPAPAYGQTLYVGAAATDGIDNSIVVRLAIPGGGPSDGAEPEMEAPPVAMLLHGGGLLFQADPLPSAAVEWFPRERLPYPATHHTYVRICADVEDAATGLVVGRYSATDGAFGSFTGLCVCYVGAVGVRRGAWEELPPGAMADVNFAWGTADGTDDEILTLGNVWLEFSDTPPEVPSSFWMTSVQSPDADTGVNIAKLGTVTAVSGDTFTNSNGGGVGPPCTDDEALASYVTSCGFGTAGIKMFRSVPIGNGPAPWEGTFMILAGFVNPFSQYFGARLGIEITHYREDGTVVKTGGGGGGAVGFGGGVAVYFTLTQPDPLIDPAAINGDYFEFTVTGSIALTNDGVDDGTRISIYYGGNNGEIRFDVAIAEYAP